MSVAPERLLGIVEFAARLSISRRQVYRLWHRSEIPSPIKHGRSIRWTESEVSAYIEELKKHRAPGGKKE